MTEGASDNVVPLRPEEGNGHASKPMNGEELKAFFEAKRDPTPEEARRLVSTIAKLGKTMAQERSNKALMRQCLLFVVSSWGHRGQLEIDGRHLAEIPSNAKLGVYLDQRHGHVRLRCELDGPPEKKVLGPDGMPVRG